jgi:hypothetical protein
LIWIEFGIGFELIRAYLTTEKPVLLAGFINLYENQRHEKEQNMKRQKLHSKRQGHSESHGGKRDEGGDETKIKKGYGD